MRKDVLSLILSCLPAALTIPFICMFVWFRKTRYIAIRSVPLTLEIILCSLVACTLGLLVICDQLLEVAAVRNENARTQYVLREALLFASAAKTLIPFVLFYREIFLRYRHGAAVSVSCADAGERKTRSRIEVLVLHPRFPFWIRVAELFIVVGIDTVAVVTINHPMVGIAGLLVVVEALLCFALGRPILKGIKRVAKEGDRLGIKVMILRISNCFLAASFCYPVVFALSVLDVLPFYFLNLPLMCLWLLWLEMIVFPVVTLLRRKDLQAGNFETEELTEVQTFHAFISLEAIAPRFMSFLKQELCAEALFFIRDADTFAKQFKPKHSRGAKLRWLDSQARSAQMGSQRYSAQGFSDIASESEVGQSQVEHGTESLGASKWSREMLQAGQRLFKKFIAPDAHHLINSDFMLMDKIRADFGKLEQAQAEGQELFSNSKEKKQAKSSFKAAKVAPVTEQVAASVVNAPISGVGSFVSWDTFEALKQEQLELLYMDTFQRFLVDENLSETWASFISEQSELEALRPSTKADNNMNSRAAVGMESAASSYNESPN